MSTVYIYIDIRSGNHSSLPLSIQYIGIGQTGAAKHKKICVHDIYHGIPINERGISLSVPIIGPPAQTDQTVEILLVAAAHPRGP